MIVGIGVDIVDIPRVEKAFARSRTRFIQRVYTETEVAYCTKRALSTQHFAARFAAKEAVFKALGTGWSRGIGWQDVEIRNDAAGLPHVFLSGRAEEMFQQKGGGRILISISHTGQMAIAQAVWIQCDTAISSVAHDVDPPAKVAGFGTGTKAST
jgi:holo-[acyl-carrier protein] synthase